MKRSSGGVLVSYGFQFFLLNRNGRTLHVSRYSGVIRKYRKRDADNQNVHTPILNSHIIES